jgi:hypothetical protein
MPSDSLPILSRFDWAGVITYQYASSTQSTTYRCTERIFGNVEFSPILVRMNPLVRRYFALFGEPPHANGRRVATLLAGSTL